MLALVNALGLQLVLDGLRVKLARAVVGVLKRVQTVIVDFSRVGDDSSCKHWVASVDCLGREVDHRAIGAAQ